MGQTSRFSIKRKKSFYMFLIQFFVNIFFSISIIRLQENGVYEHEVLKSITPKGFGRRLDIDLKLSEEVLIKELTFSDITGVLLLLLFGFAISIACIMTEIIVYLCYSPQSEIIVV